MPRKTAVQTSVRTARKIWNNLSREALTRLREIATQYDFSVGAGDLIYLNNGWYVTHTGLIGLARRKRCSGIHVEAVDSLCDSAANRFVLKATVFPSKGSSGFVGYGDADPSNVSSLVRGAEMRVAETRAVNRALRKAYGIGLCSVEELGSFSAPQKPFVAAPPSNGHRGSNGSSNGQPRLRDKLCLLIRKYELDPNLVKRYAADFCGTQELRDAGRDLVEAFVSTVSEEAAKDRAALICKLNSYSQPQEVRS